MRDFASVLMVRWKSATANPVVPLHVSSEGGTQIRVQDERFTNKYGDIQSTGHIYLTSRNDSSNGGQSYSRGHDGTGTTEYARFTGSGKS